MDKTQGAWGRRLRQAALLLGGVLGAGLAAAQSFTLEGCRASSETPYVGLPGTFLCADAAYTTGNLGKFWDELDNVPLRLTIKTGQSAAAGQVALVVDREDATRPGFDRMSAPLLKAGSPLDCPASLNSPPDAVKTPPGQGLGGIDVSLYRTIHYEQPANLSCTYEFYARLALFSRLFPGSSLHANVAIVNPDGTLTTSGVGARDISIPVNELDPPEATATLSAIGAASTRWDLSKTGSAPSLDLGDVCAAPTLPLQAQVSFNVAWTRTTIAGGNVTVQARVLATNHAARALEVQAGGTLVYNATGQTEPLAGNRVVLAANSVNQTVLDITVVRPAATAGGVGQSVSFDGISLKFFDPDDAGLQIGDIPVATVTVPITAGSAPASTATISDRMSIAALPAALTFDATQAPTLGNFLNGYVAGTQTKGPIDWLSAVQAGSGGLQFTSRVQLAERRILTDVPLSNVAQLLTSDQVQVNAPPVKLSVSSFATVTLGLRKTLSIPQGFLADGQSLRVDFSISGNLGYGSTRSLSFSAAELASGSASKSIPALTGLVPDVYTVTEIGTVLISGGTETPVALNPLSAQEVLHLSPDASGLMSASRCAGTAVFANAYRPQPVRAVVEKTTVPTNPSGGSGGDWLFTLRGPGLPAEGVSVAETPNNGSGTTFGVDLLQPGLYTVTETPKTGWDLTAVTPAAQGSSLCSFTVSFPQDIGATKSCSFTNTKRGGVKLIKTLQGRTLAGSASFNFQVREGASTTSQGSILSSGTAHAANLGTVTFMVGGSSYFLVPGQAYQLCEVGLQVGWRTSLSQLAGSFVPNSAQTAVVDNSTVCLPFTAQAGVVLSHTVDNTPPPQGDARTIGYWKNHSSCDGKGKQAPRLDEVLQSATAYTVGELQQTLAVPFSGIVLGPQPVAGKGRGLDLSDFNTAPKVASSCAAAVKVLDKRDSAGAKRASSPLFNLASQLLAARLNIQANAASCPIADQAIATGSALLAAVGFDGDLSPAAGYPALSPAQAKLANATAGLLDDYNNNRLCGD